MFLYSEYYQNLLQQFASHCQTSNGEITDPDWVVYLPKEQNAEQSSQKDNRRPRKHAQFVPGIPHVHASEIFEIGCIGNTENKCLELVSAEWNNTKVTLKRHILSSCRDAIKADMEILRYRNHFITYKEIDTLKSPVLKIVKWRCTKNPSVHISRNSLLNFGNRNYCKKYPFSQFSNI